MTEAQPPQARRGRPGFSTRSRARPQARNSVGLTMGIVAAVVALAAGVGYFALAPKSPEMKSEGLKQNRKNLDNRKPYDETVPLQPGESIEYIFNKHESTIREIEVLPLDGRAILAFGALDAHRGPPDRAELLPIIQKGVIVEQGKKQIRSVDWLRDRYYCAVINLSTDKPIKVTVRTR